MWAAVLYELQPCRASDAAKLWRYLSRQSAELTGGLAGLGATLLRDARIAVSRIKPTTAKWLAGFLVGFALASYTETLNLYLLAVFSLLIFNTGFETRQEGELSAYSVFNAGQTRLLGSTTAEQFDAELRHADPALAQQAAMQEMADQVRAVAQTLREREELDQQRRVAAAEVMRAEAAANPYRKPKGKKARRDNDKVREKLLRRQEADDNDAGWSGDDGGEGEWEQWPEDA